MSANEDHEDGTGGVLSELADRTPPAAAGPLPGHITLAHVLWDNTTKVWFAC